MMYPARSMTLLRRCEFSYIALLCAITRIDGELSLIDGHARTVAALLNGAIKIAAQFDELPLIERATDLYIHIHREGPDRGVERISDLIARVVEPDEHEQLWISYCQNWLEKHEQGKDVYKSLEKDFKD